MAKALQSQLLRRKGTSWPKRKPFATVGATNVPLPWVSASSFSHAPLVALRATARLAHSSGQLRTPENIRPIRLMATQRVWERSQSCQSSPRIWPHFFDLTPSARVRYPPQTPSTSLITHSTTIMEDLDTNPVTADLAMSSSRITSRDISVSASAFSLRLYTHSDPPPDTSCINLYPLHAPTTSWIQHDFVDLTQFLYYNHGAYVGDGPMGMAANNGRVCELIRTHRSSCDSRNFCLLHTRG